MSRIRLLPWALCLLALIPSFVPQAVHAEDAWGIAMRTDAEILKFVDTLGAEAPGAEGAPAIIMYRGLGWDVLAGSRVLTRNTIVKVQDPEALAALASSFYLDARGIVGEAQAFLIRDGEVSRPEVEVEEGDGMIRRAHLSIKLDDVRVGDIVGASAVTRFDNILYFNRIPIGAHMPVAEFNLRVRCEGDHSYVIHAEGYDGLQVETVRFDDERPVEWHARAQAIPAIGASEGIGPWDPKDPYALVAESKEYVPITGEFESTLAWQRVALFLSGLREQAISKMVAAWEMAPQVTAGASTKMEAETKIFEYVRDHFGLLAGEEYDPLGSRSGQAVLDAGAATPMEQVQFMVTLLAASGLPGELAVVRPEAWGPLQDGLESFVQFQRVAIRCGTGPDDERWYVPYVDDAEPGKLPARWGTSWVLFPKEGLVAAATQASAQVMADPSIDAHAAFAQLREQAKEQGWFTLKQVGASEK